MNIVTKIEALLDRSHDAYQAESDYILDNYPMEICQLHHVDRENFDFVFYTVKPDLMKSFFDLSDCPIVVYKTNECTAEEYQAFKKMLDEDNGRDNPNLLEIDIPPDEH